MFRLAATAALLLATSVPVSAYEQYALYRIPGADIQSVTATAPEVEDPWTLEIAVGMNGGEAETLLIESDWPLDPCIAIVTAAKGDPDQIVRIVVLENAQTMNGVIVTECGVEPNLDG